jgi:hypothetical protein
MKTLLLTAAILALVAVSSPPTMAEAPKLSGGNTWPGISQRVEPGSPSADKSASHYEYQHGYDHHAVWRGHWVLVR